MSYPGKGSADHLTLGSWNAMCWECGRKKKAEDLWKYWQGYWICPRHWNPRQPQDFAKGIVEHVTPPWVQPMAEYVYSGPLQETVSDGTFTGSTLVFTSTFSASTGDFITFEDSPGYFIGPYPLVGDIEPGEVTVIRTITGGTGTGNPQYSWVVALSSQQLAYAARNGFFLIQTQAEIFNFANAHS